MENEKIIDRVRKLLAKAGSCEAIGSEHEAKAFASAAQALLVEHGLSLASLEVTHQEKPGASIVQLDKAKRRRIWWTERLASIIAKSYGCCIMLHPGSNTITIIGRESNRAVADYVIATLAKEIEIWTNREYVKAYQRDRNSIKGFRKAFQSGVLARIKERLEDMNQTFGNNASNALVVINNGVSEARNFMQSNFRLGKASHIGGSHSFNAAGFSRGREIGNGLSLSGNGIGSSDGNTLQIR